MAGEPRRGRGRPLAAARFPSEGGSEPRLKEDPPPRHRAGEGGPETRALTDREGGAWCEANPGVGNTEIRDGYTPRSWN